MWRAAVAGGAPEPLLLNITAIRPSVARSGAGVVYQNMLINASIWELPTPSSPSREPSGDPTFPRYRVDGFRYRYAVLTGWNADRVRLSERSGHIEIWVSNRDGSQANKLTSFAGGGRVRRWEALAWSADGKLIAFDTQGTTIWQMESPHRGRRRWWPRHRPLTSDAFNDVGPSWSIDGQWIYFAIRSHARGRLADLEDALIRRDCGAGNLWRRQGAGRLVGRPTRLLREAATHSRHLGEYPLEGGQEVQVVEPGPGAQRSTSQRTESS